MKKKSFFSHIILLFILSLICIALTVGIAFFAGSFKTKFFDFENLNFSNLIPVLIIGGFISCVVVGIAVLFISRSIFYKAKDYLFKEDGGNKK